jgi:glycosyltransferase involved in cell wall biosynthesis
MSRERAAKRPVVVICANTTWYVFNFRRTLIEHLSHDYEVVVAAAPDRYEERLVRMGAAVHPVCFHLGGISLIRDLRALLQLVRLYGQVQPHFVLNFTPKANIFSSLACVGRSTCVMNNISGLGRAFSDPSRMLARVASVWLYRLVSRLVTHTYYQNEHDLEFGTTAGFSEIERSSLLPGSGVDIARFRPRILPSSAPFRFLHAARLGESKGVFDYLEAAGRLRSLVPTAALHFTVAGPSESLSVEDKMRFERLLVYAEAEYIGMSDHVEELMGAAHCVVLPSRYGEGVPRSLIEAAASGKALICYPNPGCEAIVRHGSNGYVAESRTVAHLTEAMARVVQLPATEYQALCEASVRIARTEFDERIVVSDYLGRLGSKHLDRGNSSPTTEQ